MPSFRNLIATELKNQCINVAEHSRLSDSSTKPVLEMRSVSTDTPVSVAPSKQKLVDVTNFVEGSFKEDSTARNWKDLNPSLRSLLPNIDAISYVIVSFKQLPTEDFCGAPEYAFESTIRVNVSNADDAKKWLQDMMKHSCCTYRHSKGRKPGLKRVLYKVEMHCQHKRKALTPCQTEKKVRSKAKNPRKVLTHELRQKKTGCPSVLKLSVWFQQERINTNLKITLTFLVIKACFR